MCPHYEAVLVRVRIILAKGRVTNEKGFTPLFVSLSFLYALSLSSYSLLYYFPQVFPQLNTINYDPHLPTT